MSKIEKINSFFLIFAFISVLLLINEIKFIENYEEGKSFFLTFGSVGLITAILILYLLKKDGLIFIKSRLRLGNSIIIGVLGTCLTFFPAATSKINRCFANQDSVCSNYQIIEKVIVEAYRNDRYFIMIEQENEVKSILVTKEKWGNLKENKLVEICEHTGFLGFEYVSLEE